MIDDASELRIAIARVLERWQLELIDAEASNNSERAVMLATHIEDVKRALSTQAAGALRAFVAEAELAARVASLPRGADRIGATLQWINRGEKREHQ